MARSIRYAISGLGRRSWTTYLPVFSRAGDRSRGELIAVVDADPQTLGEFGERWPTQVASYLADDFARMLVEVSPDWVILAAPDYAHHAQILAALELDVSVISEKPMVIDALQAKEVLAAASSSRGHVRVAHNLRWMNLNLRVKSLLDERCLGRVTNVEFAYHLTPGHAGSYFRRWHRRRAASGGLSVTKSCHHFDLLNWWLNDAPVEVFAWTAGRHFLPGTLLPGDPSTMVPLDADIEDTIAALILYRGGALVSYTLTSCSSWEGYALMIHGTEGSLEVTYNKLSTEDYTLTLRLPQKPERRMHVPRELGRHSGADHRMTEALFVAPDVDAQAFGCLPGAHEGALAVAIGDAVNRSSIRSAPVLLNELLPLNELATPEGERLGEVASLQPVSTGDDNLSVRDGMGV